MHLGPFPLGDVHTTHIDRTSLVTDVKTCQVESDQYLVRTEGAVVISFSSACIGQLQLLGVK